MLTLGIDTAAAECAVALWSPERAILAARHEALARGQAERLLPMILECLADAGAKLESVGRIGVAVGPGAFTGLRVGLAAARGLALGGAKELVGITSFEAAAAAVGPAETGLLVLRESRREDFYAQGFAADLTALAPAEACLPADLPALCRRLFATTGPMRLGGKGALRLGGDGAPRAAAFLPDLILCPEQPGSVAAAVARLAGECAAAELAARPANPFYLRPPDTTAPAAAGTGG